MKIRSYAIPAVAALALAACNSTTSGGSTSGGSVTTQNILNQFSTLQADPNMFSLTPNATVDPATGSASYSGVLSVTTGTTSNNPSAYLGNMDATVDFGADTLSGSAGSFVEYYSLIASPTVGNSVSGSITMSGTLTGDNETPTGGITGTATGTVDGTSLNMSMTGNVGGLNREALILQFIDNSLAAGAVGYAIQ